MYNELILISLVVIFGYWFGLFDESLFEKNERKRKQRLEMSECWNVGENTEE